MGISNRAARQDMAGVNKKQQTKGFCEILAQNLFFCFFVFVLHEIKKMSRVNIFECGCTQTLDKHFNFMQFGKQELFKRQSVKQFTDYQIS